MIRIAPIAVTEAILVSSNVVEPAAAYAGGTTYAEGDTVDHDNHVWESVAGGNTGHEPGAAGSEAWWIDRGANNVWAMFDQAVGSISVEDDEIAAELQLDAGTMIDAVALLGVVATSAQLVLTDSSEGVVYDETVELLDESGIVDAYTYCFNDFERQTDVVFEGLPPYAGVNVQVTLSEPGGEAACGVCVVGPSVDFGGTQWRPKLGLLNFSVIAPNDYGYRDVVERDYAREGEFACWFPTSAVDAVLRRLAAYRATPGVWIGDERYGATMIYGFCDDASVELTEGDQSLLSLSLKGLT